MTDVYPIGSQQHESSDGGTADTVREQAGELGSTVVDAGAGVASVAKDEAAGVAREVKAQASDLFAQARQELSDQASAQKDRVASGLHTVSDDLNTMAQNGPGDGFAAGLVHEAANRAGSVASWIGDRDPGDLLAEVRAFARRRPGTFIAIAAVAGVVVGRLTRSIATNASDSSGSPSQTPSASTTQRSPVSAAAGGQQTSPTPVYSSLAEDRAVDEVQSRPTSQSWGDELR